MAVKMPIRRLGTRSMSLPLASLAVINEKQGGGALSVYLVERI